MGLVLAGVYALILLGQIPVYPPPKRTVWYQNWYRSAFLSGVLPNEHHPPLTEHHPRFIRPAQPQGCEPPNESKPSFLCSRHPAGEKTKLFFRICEFPLWIGYPTDRTQPLSATYSLIHPVPAADTESRPALAIRLQGEAAQPLPGRERLWLRCVGALHPRPAAITAHRLSSSLPGRP